MAGENINSLLKPFQDLFGSLSSALQKAVQGTAKAAQDAAKAQQAIVSPAQSAAKAMETLAMAVERLIGKLGGTMTALPAGGGKEEGGGGGAGGLALVAGGIGAAATAAASAIQSFVSQISAFVTALSPSTMQLFSMTIRDLQATIGVAFQPIFEIMSGTFQRVAGIILPLMEELKPIIQEVSEVISGNLINGIKMWVAIIEALLPVLEVLMVIWEAVNAVMQPVIILIRMMAQQLGFWLQLLLIVFSPVIEGLKILGAVMEGIGKVLDVVSIVFKTVFQTIIQSIQAFIKSIFGGGLDTVFKSIADATKAVIRYFLLFVAYIAKFLGQDKFLKNLIDNLSPKQGAKAAIQGVGTKSFEQIANDLAVASAAASGETGKKSNEDLLGDTLEEIKKIASGEKDSLTVLTDIKTAIDNLTKVVDLVLNPGKTVEKAKEVAIKRASDHPWRTAAFGPLSLLFD